MLPVRDTIRSRRVPFVTIGLIAINILIYVYQNNMTIREMNEFIYAFAVVPSLGLSQPWRLITAGFLHGGWGHLLGNMLYLWIFGDNVEDEVGHVKFILFYMLMLILASFAQILSDTSSMIPVIGASGGVAGILGAYFVLYPYSKVITFVPILLFRFVHIPASVYLIFWFGLQFLSGITADPTAASVAWWAHIGGFIAGMIVIKFLRPPPRKYYYYE